MRHMQNKSVLRSTILLSIFLVGLSFVSHAQTVITAAKADTTKKDSTKKDTPRTGIKPYEEVIRKEYSTKQGLFAVHELKDRIYFEIPNALLGRDIEVINRLVKGPGGAGFYSGEELDEHTIEFEKHLSDSTIRIRYNFVISQADSTSDIFKAVAKSNLNPIVI